MIQICKRCANRATVRRRLMLIRHCLSVNSAEREGYDRTNTSFAEIMNDEIQRIIGRQRSLSANDRQIALARAIARVTREAIAEYDERLKVKGIVL